MFLSLKTMLALGLATITKDGRLSVSCSTIRVTNCTYKGKEMRVINGTITVTLPTALKSMANELLCEQDIGLVIEIDPKRSLNEQIKAMAGLPSAPAPLQATIPAPVLEGDNLTATICVATSHSSSLPYGAQVVEQRGTCTIAHVTMNLTRITYVDERQYSLKLADESVLIFTFHNNIAQQATHLINQAHEEADIAQGRQVIQKRLKEGVMAATRDAQRCNDALVTKLSSMPSLSFLNISPRPMFDDGTGSTSTGNWVDDAVVASTYDHAPFPREVEANALTGIDIAPSREEQKAQKKQEAQRLKEAEEAKHQAELAEAQHQAELLEQQQREAQRLEQETQQQHLTAMHDVPNITVPQIWAKIYDTSVVKTLIIITRQHGLELLWNEQQHARGTLYLIDVSPLLNAGILTLRVSARGNEIVVGELTDDDTLRWGTCANVWNGSYDALVSMFPAMSVMVQQVVKTRAVLKIQKQHQHLQQGLLPVPEPMRVLPVFDMRGNVVAYQQAPPFAHQQVPPFA